MLKVFKINENQEITLYVTSRCNLSCEECIMKYLMKNSSDYEMGLDELSDFIDISEKSGYKFHYILSGGEPTLWTNLLEGLKLLRKSNTCKSIVMFTNALLPKILTKEIVSHLDQVRISLYEYNKKTSKIVESEHGSKVRIVDRTEFWANPSGCIPESLPAICLNKEFMYYNREIYACPHSASIARGAKVDLKLSVPVQVGFATKLGEIRRNQEELICSRCISNQKVRNIVVKKKNINEK